MTDIATPFRYPKRKHFRRMRPGPFSHYQAYKPALQAEFERKCIYCRAPDTIRGWESFGVDHYRPKRLFPALQNTYANLFYCCNQCNRRKGDYWPARTNLRIPNPCDHEMHKHMRFAAERVETRTPQGQVALEVLDLNAPDALQMRATISSVLRILQQKLVELRSTLAALQRFERTVDVAEAAAEVEAEAEKIQTEMNWFLGR